MFRSPPLRPSSSPARPALRRRHALAAVVASCLPLTASVAAAGAAPASPVQGAPVTADAAFASLSASVHDRYEAGYTPSIAAAVVSADDPRPRVIAFGRTGRQPVTGGTTFEIGSITKTFTATLLAEMVGRGEVQLSDPVRTLLPAGTVVPAFEGREITLEDLAEHRSGLPREATDLFGGGPVPASIGKVAKAYAAYSPARMLAFLSTYRLTRAPGAAYEYSNLGEGLLGYALSVRAGRPWEQLLRERVLGPLGIPGIGTEATPLATPHDVDGHRMPNADLGAMEPAGGLRASVVDLAAYARANLLAAGDTSTGALADAMRLAMASRTDTEAGMRIGLNWITGGQLTERLIQHDGGTFGSSAYLAIDPAAKLAVVVLSASSDGVSELGAQALSPGVPLRSYPTERRARPAQLAGYTGRYDLGGGEVATLTVERGRLVAHIPGAAPIVLRWLGGDRFFSRIGLEVSFRRDHAGRVISLTSSDGSEPTTAKRLR
ncbi:MAG: serine hydrolase [Patulibacter minatonensis]